jgi:uncharacterized repeat protein (TIGR03803 family)
MSQSIRAATFLATIALVALGLTSAGAALTRSPQPVQRRAGHGGVQILYSFKGGEDGALPAAGLTVDKTGALYGTTQSGGTKNHGTVFKLTPTESGYAESVLHAFAGGKTDGELPSPA